ncbi:MAG: tetratricopeptide repeat protein [Acidobacteriota bacterium]|nr:tetratricopeptide repeat protein [Acidobacteriota bacterium]
MKNERDGESMSFPITLVILKRMMQALSGKTRSMNTLRRIAISVTLLCVVTSHPSFSLAHDGVHEQIAEVTRQIERDPQNAALYLKRGELHRLHRDWNKATLDYDRAARLNPQLAAVDHARGKMLYESGKHEPAKLRLDRFLSRQPEHVEALVTRGRVLAKLSRHAEAARDFTAAIALSSPRPQPEMYIERAEALAAAGEEFRAEALRGLDEGIEKLGSLVTLQLAALDLELAEKLYDRALARLERITAAAPRKETWLARRGEILERAGRNAEARDAYAAALAAIETLPPHRRRVKAATELETRLRAALER